MSVKDRVAQVAQHVIVAGLKLKQKLGAMVRLVCLISSEWLSDDVPSRD
jgi:hypothetical protein